MTRTLILAAVFALGMAGPALAQAGGGGSGSGQGAAGSGHDGGQGHDSTAPKGSKDKGGDTGGSGGPG